MASSAYDGLERARKGLKRSAECPATPRTPLRQRIPSSTICPDAPRKHRRLAQNFAAPAWPEHVDNDSLPFWTNGRPLGSFDCTEASFVPTSFTTPNLSAPISDMPLLGSSTRSNDSLLCHPSPLPRTTQPVFGDCNTPSGLGSSSGSRKRVRGQTQRQLKFDSLAGPQPATSFEFPKLADFNLPDLNLKSFAPCPELPKN